MLELSQLRRTTGKSRVLPVRARCSERRCFMNRPLVAIAAKVLKEPQGVNVQCCGEWRLCETCAALK